MSKIFFRLLPSSLSIIILLLLVSLNESVIDIDLDDDGTPACDRIWRASAKGSKEVCDKISEIKLDKKLHNLPILNAIHCFNNGTGICKAIAGRFEFYFNTFEDKVIGPAPASQFVDEQGYHKRVPVAYNIDGNVTYADRAINWADEFTSQPKNLSLLNVKDFNWCAFTEGDYWPYRSAIIDHKSKGRFHIYFFNRQSCIYDKQTGKSQHYNTRFLHNSSLRIDLDMNPTIFAMEDRIAGEIRLVKHKRQHWYEVEYEVIERPRPEILYFVAMADREKKPLKINGTGGGILGKWAYRGFSDICLSDFYTANRDKKDDKNSHVVSEACGTEQNEIVDVPYPAYKLDRDHVPLQVSLHNLPRDSQTTGSFYNTDISLESWLIFAKDGFTFSATTTIPLGQSTTETRVIALYANFKGKDAEHQYDEYYPLPFLSDYIAKYKKTSSGRDWTFDRESKAKPLKGLNYVDDIAYLHSCDKILIIFGPLYSQTGPNEFGLETRAPLGSISKLGLGEPVNAFFAIPDAATLILYHRTNYVVEHSYTCGKNGALVTAQRVGKYRYRYGKNMISFFPKAPIYATTIDIREEYFFQRLNVYKGNAEPDAPNPALFKSEYDKPIKPAEPEDNTWLYILAGIGTLLILLMCIICMVTLRRRHRRRMRDLMTKRSSSIGSKISSASSARSALPTRVPSSKFRSRQTTRSSLSGKPSKSSQSSRSTNRSGMPSAQTSKASSSLGPRMSRASNQTRRSSISSKKPLSRASSRASSSASGSKASLRTSGTKRSTMTTK